MIQNRQANPNDVAVGAAISWGIFNAFKDDEGTVNVSFGTYMLFIGKLIYSIEFVGISRLIYGNVVQPLL